jgi:hypothetical protein
MLKLLNIARAYNSTRSIPIATRLNIVVALQFRPYSSIPHKSRGNINQTSAENYIKKNNVRLTKMEATEILDRLLLLVRTRKLDELLASLKDDHYLTHSVKEIQANWPAPL